MTVAVSAARCVAVTLIDVLDHLFAPLVLEIDIDVGRLLAFLRDEALEQEIDLRGIDGGDAEHIADGGVGRRAAALAQDLFALGEADDVVDGEEIRRDLSSLDQARALSSASLHLVGNASG